MSGFEKNGRILIIEDDREISNIVAMNLGDLGFEPVQVHDGLSGLDAALNQEWVLIILDVMLPETDGISICRKIRETDQLVPLMMLTARAEEIDRVLGLELGADDYMTKPFSVRELQARVRALLRRSRAADPAAEPEDPGRGGIITIGGLSLDTVRHRAELNGNPLELTVKEFELLSLFMRNPGRAYSRADLLNLIWSYNFEGYEHTVNTHINRLRNKIEEDAARPEYLLTVWGIGYRFAEGGEVEK